MTRFFKSFSWQTCHSSFHNYLYIHTFFYLGTEFSNVVKLTKAFEFFQFLSQQILEFEKLVRVQKVWSKNGYKKVVYLFLNAKSVIRKFYHEKWQVVATSQDQTNFKARFETMYYKIERLKSLKINRISTENVLQELCFSIAKNPMKLFK